MPKGVYERSKGIEFGPEGGPEMAVEIPTTGEISREDLITEVERTGDMVAFKDKAEELAFMEEPVTIFLHEGAHENDVPVVQVGVNGTMVHLQRGREHTIKRKYLLNLLTSLPTSYKTIEGPAADGSRAVHLRSHTANKYPLAILNDTRRGMEWAKRIQQTAR